MKVREVFAFELSVKPHGFVAAEHIHLKQEETFEVNRGMIRFRINGKEADAVVGQRVVVPAGTFIAGGTPAMKRLLRRCGYDQR